MSSYIINVSSICICYKCVWVLSGLYIGDLPDPGAACAKPIPRCTDDNIMEARMTAKAISEVTINANTENNHNLYLYSCGNETRYLPFDSCSMSEDICM